MLEWQIWLFYRLWSVMIFVFFYPRRQWVREEDLAKELKLHSKQLHQTLQFFSEEKLVTRGEVRTFVVFIFTRVLVSYCYCFCIFILCTFCSLTLFSAKLTIKVWNIRKISVDRQKYWWVKIIQNSWKCLKKNDKISKSTHAKVIL